MSSSTDFQGLFDAAPISLWLEDHSQLKQLFEAWRAEGVEDLQAHLRADPARWSECRRCVRVLQVNQQTLQQFGAETQQELIDALDRVFSKDIEHGMAREFQMLWDGVLDFSNQSVNYTLSGQRLDILIHVRVLPGHEARWDRVMVSLQDITAPARDLRQLRLSERNARSLFELSPVSLWVEDFSAVKEQMDAVRASGVQDFRTFLDVHPDFVGRCMSKIRVLDVNQHTLAMFAARDKEELISRQDDVFRGEMRASFAEQLMDLWHGKLHQVREVVNYALDGELINIHMQFAIMPGHEAAWDRVLVSLVDITARRKAEAYLEYLGTHDSLTRLRNRAYYNEELNRMTRRGTWPLSILAMDLNGLKHVNDSQGHAAGDALLRRVGEVLTKAGEELPGICMARTGGDEFVALIPGADERAAQHLMSRIENIMELNNQFYPGQKLSLSMGYATCKAPADVEAAIHRADQLMFLNKKDYYAESGLDRRL